MDTLFTSLSSSVALASSSSSSGYAARAMESSRVNKKRKADGEHLEDPQREHAK